MMSILNTRKGFKTPDKRISLSNFMAGHRTIVSIEYLYFCLRKKAPATSLIIIIDCVSSLLFSLTADHIKDVGFDSQG